MMSLSATVTPASGPTVLAREQSPIDQLGPQQRLLAVDERVGVEAFLGCLAPIEIGGDQLAHRDGADPDELHLLGGGEERVDHRREATADRRPPTAHRPPPTAFLLPAYCLLPAAYRRSLTP